MTAAPPASSASVRRRLTAATALISTVGMLTLIVVVLLVAWRTTDHEIDQVVATRLAAVRSAAGLTTSVTVCRSTPRTLRAVCFRRANSYHHPPCDPYVTATPTT